MGNRKVKQTENNFSNKTFFIFSVAQGIRLMKDNDSNSAILHFNKALATDPKCVDALVARGALSANQGHYKRAMQDFEDALKIDHKHINALKYLHDVLNNIANA
jgi:lipopolysaccharide biosynthesis regulator YciM